MTKLKGTNIHQSVYDTHTLREMDLLLLVGVIGGGGSILVVYCGHNINLRHSMKFYPLCLALMPHTHCCATIIFHICAQVGKKVSAVETEPA